MATEAIKVGEEVLEIEVSPITIVVPSVQASMGPRITFPQRVELHVEDTTHHGLRVC